MLSSMLQEVEAIPIVHVVEIYCTDIYHMTECNCLSIR